MVFPGPPILGQGRTQGQLDVLAQVREKLKRQPDRCKGRACVDLIYRNVIELCHAVLAAAYILKDEKDMSPIRAKGRAVIAANSIDWVELALSHCGHVVQVEFAISRIPFETIKQEAGIPIPMIRR